MLNNKAKEKEMITNHTSRDDNRTYEKNRKNEATPKTFKIITFYNSIPSRDPIAYASFLRP